MGYSLDNSTNTIIVNGTAVSAEVTASLGGHVLHVKSWGNRGASCVTDVAITVVAIPPSNAVAVYGIQKQPYYWQGTSDSSTGSGIANGSMSLVSSPTISGVSRMFSMHFNNSGGERYWASFAADPLATNFLYDARVWVAAPSNDIANIEMDMNQVMENGQTVIYGFQCDGYSGTWDYTTNAGTPESPVDEWRHSAAPCNPRSWSTNTWHHIQIAYSRDQEGNVTYKYVTFDGAQKNLDVTTPSAFALGWGSTLITNFQIDGLGGYGSATVYVDNLTVYRW